MKLANNDLHAYIQKTAVRKKSKIKLPIPAGEYIEKALFTCTQ